MNDASHNDGQQDPEADNEALRYENPIASRRYILEVLSEVPDGLTLAELQAALEIIDEDQVEALRRRVIAMSRDSQIKRDHQEKYTPIPESDFITGRVTAHRDGYGIVKDESGKIKEPFILPFYAMKKAIHGDRVVIYPTKLDQRGRMEANFVRLLERQAEVLVGRLYEHDDQLWVNPDHPRIQHQIQVEQFQCDVPDLGHLVSVQVTHWPTRDASAKGVVLESLGNGTEPGIETQMAIRSFGIPYLWPKEIEENLQAFPKEVSEWGNDRKDLRELPFVTIDGEDARDFDDAVYAEAESDGWRLWVAIADVSHYVQPESAMEKEALNRGNSVYFPNQVVPMLPEVLSNGLCSLNPQVNRLSMVCEMQLSASGDIEAFEFYPAVIFSHARLTYARVAKALEGEEDLSVSDPELNERLPQIETLNGVYRALKSAREARGSLDMDTQEMRIRIGADGQISGVEPVVRNDAHRLIEECMLAANVCSARLLNQSGLGGIYRVHDQPPSDRIERLQGFLTELGLRLNMKGLMVEPSAFSQLLQSVSNRPDYAIIQVQVLRSMSQAFYTASMGQHFGLNLPAYTHFTSPIRRYPDLLVHRLLSHLWKHGVANSECSKEACKGLQPLVAKEAIEDIAQACSNTERRADEATRDVMERLKCKFMLEKVGEVCEGQISSVNSFGLFIQLTDYFIEGLLHVSALGQDFFAFDAARQQLIGQRTGQTYSLGDWVKVRVARVNEEERQIDFALPFQLPSPGKGGKSKRSSSRPPFKGKRRRKR